MEDLQDELQCPLESGALIGKLDSGRGVTGGSLRDFLRGGEHLCWPRACSQANGQARPGRRSPVKAEAEPP